jgi:hypothetical protein
MLVVIWKMKWILPPFVALVVALYLDGHGFLKVLYGQKWEKFAVLVFAVSGTYLDGDGSLKVLYDLPLALLRCSIVVLDRMPFPLHRSADRVLGQSSMSRASAQAGPPQKACQGRRHRAFIL